MAPVSPSTQFAALYLEHRQRALAVARRILKSSSDAEDAVHEVFARLYERNQAFDGRCAYFTWLHRVVVNACINRLRAQKRLTGVEWMPEAGEGPEAACISQEQHQLVCRAIGRLPTTRAAVVMMRDVRGYTYEHIARALGIPNGTVKSNLNRGRTELRARLDRMMRELPAGALSGT